MNTQAADKQQAPAVAAVPNTHWAKLTRGETYFLGDTRFTKGKPVTIPAYIKKHLEVHAVDMVDVEGQAEAKQKFEFTPITDGDYKDVSEKVVPTRTRRTPIARVADENGSKQIST